MDTPSTVDLTDEGTIQEILRFGESSTNRGPFDQSYFVADPSTGNSPWVKQVEGDLVSMGAHKIDWSICSRDPKSNDITAVLICSKPRSGPVVASTFTMEDTIWTATKHDFGPGRNTQIFVARLGNTDPADMTDLHKNSLAVEYIFPNHGDDSSAAISLVAHACDTAQKNGWTVNARAYLADPEIAIYEDAGLAKVATTTAETVFGRRYTETHLSKVPAVDHGFQDSV